MTLTLGRALRAAALGVLLPVMAFAQGAQGDLDDLQAQVGALGQRIEQLRGSDPGRAMRLGNELDQVRDEVAYLRVRLRRENSLPPTELAAVRDRLRTLEREVSGTALREAPPTARTGEISVGQELDARLQTPLNSSSAEVEDRFEATTLIDLYQGDQLLVPAGSVLRGVVSGVERATRTDRRGSLTLSFDQMTVNGRTYRIRASVTQAIEGEGLRGEVGKMTTGAAAGAIIGGILGGFKGAMAGILIGGGGAVLATPGTNVNLEAGTVLRVRFDAPVSLSDAPDPGR